MTKKEILVLIKPDGELIKGQETPCGKCLEFCIEKFYPNKNTFPITGICGFRIKCQPDRLNADTIAGVFCPIWMRSQGIDMITIKYRESIIVKDRCKCCGKLGEKEYTRARIAYFDGHMESVGVYNEEE